jgi:hypothetical protein
LYTGFWLENLKERDHLEDIGTDGRINIKMDLKQNLSMPTEFIWLRVGTMGSCQHGTISGFHKMYKIC